jgi:aminobenzoyl-glutamate utilization protein B
MARAGLFDGVDATHAWHPAPFAGAGVVRLNATSKARVQFRGRTAHAGNSPWDGRSALKAAELFGMGVQMMREHVLPTARIHYIYDQAGVAPNIVPDAARIWIVMRDLDRAKLDPMVQWVGQIAQAAAMATQTQAEYEVFYGTWDLLPNEPLARRLYSHVRAVPLEWTAAEQEFARACQRAAGLAETGMLSRPLPFIENASAGASTDVGDVSYLMPTGVFGWATVPAGVSMHTWIVTACAGMSIGDKASLNTARILAACGHDLLTDPALLDAAKADFRRRRGDRPFVSAVPAERTRPLSLPAFMTRTGEDELFAGVPST